MKAQIRRFAVGAATAGVLAGVGVFALPTGTAGWQPVTYGLTTSAEQMLPATVSEAQPARVVTTTIDEDGRPVVKVEQATDRQSATSLVEDAQRAKNAVSVELDATAYALDVPSGSDPQRAKQWDLAKLRVDEAWTKSTGAGVTVAVIDTGVDASHADLKANVLSGYDAIANKAGVSTDGNGHGTHVAGTIAAVTGNGVGISGIAPDVKILPIKTLGANGSGNMSDTAEGITWAVDHGAQVINMSLGSDAKVAAVTNAIKYARSKGVTVVAAAGNSRQEGNPTNYPGADEGVIGVAATDSNDRYGSYSNAGSYVDVAAPGSDILSTAPNSAYKTMSGTSMASPHVAAVAALLKSFAPRLTPDEIEATLEKTAVDLGKAGFDNDYGNGRIDPVAALESLTPVTAPPSTSPPSAPPVSSAPPVKVTPVITASASASEVVHGTSTVTTFTVTADGKARAQQAVSVCVTEGAGPATCTDTTTTDAGTVAVTRTAKTAFQVQLKIADPAVESAPVAYQVRAAVSVTASGSQLTVKVTGAAGQTTKVQQLSSGTWRTVATYKAQPVSRFTGLRAGQQYRAVVADATGLLGATSNVVKA
ncbi:S8 family peptidase [Actinoplanes sp. NPDC051861]|uniref:S8 family peptidase n=1 Tax=Actinoplanes sp. NPDC051861 TaxID=3155170 RepID=UPI0034343225